MARIKHKKPFFTLNFEQKCNDMTNQAKNSKSFLPDMRIFFLDIVTKLMFVFKDKSDMNC